MELNQIKELMVMMEKTKAKRLVIKRGEFEIELEMGSSAVASLPPTQSSHENPMKEEMGKHLEQAAPSLIHHNNTPVVEGGTFITSPMVGTFYTTPSPDDPPFIKVGDRVEKGQVVCIIEAMKVMNEVKAEETGVVKKVLVENSQPVEFGTKLFQVG